MKAVWKASIACLCFASAFLFIWPYVANPRTHGGPTATVLGQIPRGDPQKPIIASLLRKRLATHSDYASSRASALTGACWILVNLHNLARAQASAGRGREFAANYLQIAA
jgi:hypothetical protein